MSEIKHKNFCVEEFNSIWFAEEDREKEDFIAQIEDLELTMKKTAN